MKRSEGMMECYDSIGCPGECETCTATEAESAESAELRQAISERDAARGEVERLREIGQKLAKAYIGRLHWGCKICSPYEACGRHEECETEKILKMIEAARLREEVDRWMTCRCGKPMRHKVLCDDCDVVSSCEGDKHPTCPLVDESHWGNVCEFCGRMELQNGTEFEYPTSMEETRQ